VGHVNALLARAARWPAHPAAAEALGERFGLGVSYTVALRVIRLKDPPRLNCALARTVLSVRRTAPRGVGTRNAAKDREPLRRSTVSENYRDTEGSNLPRSASQS
jgi:hypothetical protein